MRVFLRVATILSLPLVIFALEFRALRGE